MFTKAASSGSPKRGLGFATRMMLSLGLTLAAVGGVQYGLVAHTVTQRADEQLASDHSADAKVLRELYNAPGAGLLEAEEALDNLAARPGVHRVALLDATGLVLAVGRPRHDVGAHSVHEGAEATAFRGALDPQRIVKRRVDDATAALVLAVSRSGEPTVHADGRDKVVRVPLLLRQEHGVLEVVRSGDEVRQQVADLRSVLLLTLALGLALAMPAFYLLGGRQLSNRHGQALQSSTTDALTGLRNHRSFHETLREELGAAQRGGRPLTLVLVDLDGFKQVNDTFGHRRGDTVLASVAFVLREHVPPGCAYRLGGDEFALLLPGATLEEGLDVAERVRETVEFSVEGVTTSIGVAGLDASAPDAESLVEHADVAMYAAKRSGRNQVVNAAELLSEPVESLSADVTSERAG
ncbi:diguanylate cyclase (GGDEF)-like protein [Kineococcus xinjiangensis]|uniref:Diguanylate cyclase (GGDEF)-like protein n=1 Tax=Kineococcus xinjiangensis TaxID=512762 RepID=A0A2S6IU25_9ACTN|nr:GGDEF domain-containing protein [Kineococcus xinjiangensis]PPK97680.1 diguanylate cyclase (GGDEF)-like protein [Kineococcus xinjiangensis]